jgi:hypothetical protein
MLRPSRPVKQLEETRAPRREGKPVSRFSCWFMVLDQHPSRRVHFILKLVMFDSLRNRPQHERLLQHDSESHDDDTLLPGSSSSTSLTLKSPAHQGTSHDIRVAVRTLIACTIVYLGAALWIAFSVRGSTLISDPDDFCIHHVSQYCT